MLVETTTGHYLISGPVRTDPNYTLSAQKGTPMCSLAVSAQGRDAPLVNLRAFYDLAMVLSTAQKGDAIFAVARKDLNEYNGKTYTNYLCEFVSVASAQAAAGAVMPTQQPRSLTDGAQQIDEGDEPLPF